MPVKYDPDQVRSILIGLGYLSPTKLPAQHPLSTNKNALTDSDTKNAIGKFQEQYKGTDLKVDQTYGPQTAAKLEKVMTILHTQLNTVVKPNPPFSLKDPFYGPRTIEVVKAFEKSFLKNKEPKGIASPQVRVELDTQAGIAKKI